MDQVKTGALIRAFRTELGLTQQQLADRLQISPKTVSKWECGLGCPDVALLPPLARELGVDLSRLLEGQLDPNDTIGGNMKKLKFMLCPTCGSLTTSTGEAAVSCCGKTLLPQSPQTPDPDHRLEVVRSDGEYVISSPHPMTKEHSITFVALLTGDAVFLRKLYPEWDCLTRIPCFGHGILLWHCSRHGMFRQLV